MTTVEELGVEHRRIVAGRPQTNGCVERVQGTILEECWKPAFARHLLPNITGLREELRRYLRYYNPGGSLLTRCQRSLGSAS